MAEFFVYKDKSDNWERYLYTIEDIFMNKNIDFRDNVCLKM